MKKSKKKKRISSKLLAAIIILAAVVLLLKQEEKTEKTSSGFSAPETGIVEKVYDGDSLRLTNKVPIRLIGIDCPEKDTPYSEEAGKFTTKLLEGHKIKLEYDKEKKDKYGRFLAYVLYKENSKWKIVNIEIIRAGLAYAYSIKPNILHRKEIIQAQEEARRNKLGVWKQQLKKEKEYIVVWGSKFGITHRPKCEKIMNRKNIERFKTREEALDTGSPPCRICRP
ncbi:MAG: thermonuclease family protein [Planctomycetota bacterium]